MSSFEAEEILLEFRGQHNLYSVPIETVHSGIADIAFASACNQFRQQLSERDKAMFTQYPAGDEMILAISKEAECHPIHQSRISGCAKKFKDFTLRLSKLYPIVNVFKRTQPEDAEFVWGTLRLVFRVCRFLNPSLF